jgi:hypothetical protein
VHGILGIFHNNGARILLVWGFSVSAYIGVADSFSLISLHLHFRLLGQLRASIRHFRFFLSFFSFRWPGGNNISTGLTLMICICASDELPPLLFL